MGADSSMYNLLGQELDFEINLIDWPTNTEVKNIFT